MPITANQVVTLEYTLHNAAGELLDSSEDNEPLSYLHGSGEIVPGLERALDGLEVGEERDIVVAPEDAYGEINPAGIFPVPRSAFPSDMKIEAGDTMVGEDDQGEMIPVRVVEVKGDTVLVDANHPLAGQQLHYHIKVRSIRAATDEEKSQGHIHEDGCNCCCGHEDSESN